LGTTNGKKVACKKSKGHTGYVPYFPELRWDGPIRYLMTDSDLGKICRLRKGQFIIALALTGGGRSYVADLAMFFSDRHIPFLSYWKQKPEKYGQENPPLR